MQSRLVDIRDVTPDEVAAWRILADRALEPNPYFEPDFLLLSARHFPGYADTRLVVVEDGDAFRGLLPVAQFVRRRIPPARVAMTIGVPTAVSALSTPLVDRDCPDEAVETLIDGLGAAAARRGWPGIVSLDMFGSDGPVAEALHRACAARRRPVFAKEAWVRGMVTRSGRWGNPLAGDRKRETARKQRKLARDLGADVRLAERTLDPSAVDEFLRMEASGWKGRDGGRAFARWAETTAWFRDWHECWTAAGRVHVLSLEVGDASIAMQYFVRAGAGLFYFRTAYDEEYGRYAPGAVLLTLAMQHLFEHTDAEWLDSSTNKNNGFLLEMMPELRHIEMLLIGAGGALDRRLVAALPAMTNAAAARRKARERLAKVRPGS